MKRILTLIPALFLMFSCKYETNRASSTDNLASMNGVWELESAECGDSPSLYWAHLRETRPVNVRKQVNNGQAIDYVVDSESCMQTITSHLVPEGGFLFTKYDYQKFCSSQCKQDQVKCGKIDATNHVRIEISEDQMVFTESSDSVCRKMGQSGPLKFRYRLLETRRKSNP